MNLEHFQSELSKITLFLPTRQATGSTPDFNKAELVKIRRRLLAQLAILLLPSKHSVELDIRLSYNCYESCYEFSNIRGKSKTFKQCATKLEL
jgi:hypothetical protein